MIEGLLPAASQEIETAFLASVDLIRSDADFGKLVNSIKRNDIEAALDAIRVDDAAFAVFSAQLVQAFATGGNAGAKSMPARKKDGSKLLVRFNERNVDAENWIRGHSSNAVKEIVDDQRTLIRNALSAGIQAGENPRTTALDLVGRIDKKTGKRIGGSIGLTSSQEQIVRNAAAELDGGDLRNYLTRKARDKRFDRHVARALRTGQPIPADIRQKMISRYKDNYLRLRGETIGLTEAMATLHRGRYQAFAQAIAAGDVLPEEVVRTWNTASDSRVRDSHRAMNGQTIGFNAKYRTPSGATLLHPGDPSGPPSEIIRCRCTESIRVNYLNRLR